MASLLSDTSVWYSVLPYVIDYNLARTDSKPGWCSASRSVLDYTNILHLNATSHYHVDAYIHERSQGTFQSSNPIGQYIIHNYMCICTNALTPP